MRDLYQLLEPLLKYYVCFHLGPEWTILVTYQLFQGLCCEMRKEHDRRYRRRTDPDSRRLVYAAHLNFFMFERYPQRQQQRQQQQQKQQLSNSNSNSLADTSQKIAYRRLQPAFEMSFKDILEVFASHPTVLNSRATGINFSAR